MTTHDLLQTCRDRGVTLTVNGDRIHAAGPMDDALVAELRNHKADLLDHLRPPPAPSAPWPKDQEPIPDDDLGDPYWQWIDGATIQTHGVRMVRCADCRHCNRNLHSPGLGWSTCNVLTHGGGWPAKLKSCSRFEPADRQSDAGGRP